jgi:hypothetical protein
LREQEPQRRLDVAQRGHPDFQRRLDRCVRHP